MKQMINRRDLPLVCLALGGLGLVLKKGLYALGLDALGLLIPWHPMGIGLMLVTVAVLALIVAQAKTENTGEKSARMGCAGCFFSAAGILLTVTLIPPLTTEYTAFGWRILGFAAGISQILTGYVRLSGKKPLFFPHLLVSAFYVFHILDHYRAWSSDPQILDFLFTLLGTVTLALFAFYCAAEDVGLGRSRARLGTGLAALYFCVVELADTNFFLLFLSSIVWVYTALLPSKPRKEADDRGAA